MYLTEKQVSEIAGMLQGTPQSESAVAEETAEEKEEDKQ